MGAKERPEYSSDPILDNKGSGKWHFIGIGGVGMSGIARVWLELGHPVSGSDLNASALTDGLISLGARVYIGKHDAAYISDDLDAVVVSSAVPDDNPELIAAREKGIPIMHRASCLARLMQYKKAIAVSGTHGKSTTSAMIAWLLDQGGLAPAFFIGAYVNNLEGNGRWGQGDYMVVEADESDGSFLELAPDIVLVTNVEDDHLDYYGSQEKLDEAFVTYINKVPASGTAILCADDTGLRRLMASVEHKRILTYGFSEDADMRGVNLQQDEHGVSADVLWHGEQIGSLTLQVYGKHNLLNALGALVAGVQCGLGFDNMASTMREFRGTQRRMEFMGEAAGVVLYDDYAHHPSEIEAVLKAVRQIGKARTVVVFQPHRYSRTQLLYTRFGPAFEEADILVLLPIYAAFEDPVPGVDVTLIAEEVAKHHQPYPIMAADFEETCDILCDLLSPGDLVLTMGAGNVRDISEMLRKRLESKDKQDREETGTGNP